MPFIILHTEDKTAHFVNPAHIVRFFSTPGAPKGNALTTVAFADGHVLIVTESDRQIVDAIDAEVAARKA